MKIAGATGVAGLLSSQSIAAADDGEDEFGIVEATAAEIYAQITNGDVTAKEVVEIYLDRIEAYEDKLNSIITVNEDALDRADELDEELEESGPVGPLHGVPIVLKDNIDTDDLPTTGGNVLFEDSIPPNDAHIVSQLRNAGGIILAKNTLGEFASGSNSSLGGQIYNPYDLEREPGGSSGGTGAGVAANLGAIGVGTDTGGSVRIPAVFNSLVGLRPTTGLMSRDGIIPLSETLDTAGPMTKTVTDTAIMLDVMSGYDSTDPRTAESIGEIPSEGYTSYLNRDGLEGKQIGVIREYIEDDPEETGIEAGQPLDVAEVIETAISDLADAGATIVDPVTIPDVDELATEGYVASSAEPFELERDLNKYLEERGEDSPVETTQEIRESDTIAVERTAERFESTQEIDVDTLDENVDYLSGLQSGEMLRRNLFEVMATKELDAFIYPTASRTPAKVDEDRPSGINTTLSPAANFPSITVPAGYTPETHLPVNLEFLARPFEEPLLIEMAYSYEQITRLREPPENFDSI